MGVQAHSKNPPPASCLLPPASCLLPSLTQRQLSEILQDILEAIADIEAFTDGVDFETFRTNREKILKEYLRI